MIHLVLGFELTTMYNRRKGVFFNFRPKINLDCFLHSQEMSQKYPFWNILIKIQLDKSGTTLLKKSLLFFRIL